ncbi:MAG: hypothetical protein Kow0047_11330 [Anaerolineae bacterium]
MKIRLLAAADPAADLVRFSVAFAAPTDQGMSPAYEATLDPGDGSGALSLGLLCAPTAFTWREQRVQEVASHWYQGAGPWTATVQWGDHVASCEVGAGGTRTAVAAATSEAELRLFQARVRPESPLEVDVTVHVEGLPTAARVRVDGGAGQVHWLEGVQGSSQESSWTLVYPKPGTYGIAADLLDEDGFWVATLAEASVEVKEPLPEGQGDQSGPALTSEMKTVRAAEAPALGEAQAATALPPWIPFRYVRPMWAWSQTYVGPGGGAVSRTLQPGTYLAIQGETWAGGEVWYQSTYGDWIQASAVDVLKVSELRGVELGQPQPPAPEPEPPSPPEPEEPEQPSVQRQGIVTAWVLNVRAEPGVRPDNPPVDRLVRDTIVDILAEAQYAGETWYRIGERRWVHSGWVRLLETPASTRRGVVTASVLNVRAQPGVRPDNPPIDRLRQGTVVFIYEEAPYEGAIWYRIGDGRWVHSGWVELIAAPASAMPIGVAAAEGYSLPVGWVVSTVLNVRARPGVSADNPPIDQLTHNQVVPILDQYQLGSETWYRIGEDRWVYGGWIAAAFERARPASIGADERWVGVNLSQQTLVAYEGDRPVYAAMVATGLPGTPTVQGIFRTWWRVPWRKMSGGRPGMYYYLEEVPWTCYFYKGYALHGAYWHDAFGRPRSHGCVNLSLYDAWWIFRWSEPGGPNSPAVYVYWA